MSDQLPEGQSTPVESTAPQKPSRPKKLLPAIALVVIVGAIAL